jgi:hypothetical protein
MPRSRAICWDRSSFLPHACRCGFSLLFVLTSAAASWAGEGPPRVTLIQDPADLTILPRLRAELVGLGLDVRVVAKNETESLPYDLIAAARSTEAVAAFRVVVSADRADVWIADRVTGKVVLREMLPRGAQMDGRVVALRAVELLRVSLMELDAPRAPQGEVPASPKLTETSGLLPDTERFSLSASSSLLWSPGGTSPGIGVAAALAWRPSWLGVRLFGGSLLSPATLTRPEGTGEVTTRWLGLDAVAQPRQTRMPWRPRAGIGFAALATDLRGVAGSPTPTYDKTVYTFSPTASVDLGWAIHRHLRVELSVAYLRPLRGVNLIVAGYQAGSYGQNILLANLGLDIVL